MYFIGRNFHMNDSVVKILQRFFFSKIEEKYNIFGNICVIIVCWPVWDVLNLKIKLIFLIKSFFLYDRKFKRKIHIFWEREELLGQTKVICWSTGPTDPILSKNKKVILQNFGQLAFILNYYFLLYYFQFIIFKIV